MQGSQDGVLRQALLPVCPKIAVGSSIQERWYRPSRRAFEHRAGALYVWCMMTGSGAGISQ